MLLHNFLENKSNTREFTEFSTIRKSSINSSKQCTVLEKERFKKGEKNGGSMVPISKTRSECPLLSNFRNFHFHFHFRQIEKNLFKIHRF